LKARVLFAILLLTGRNIFCVGNALQYLDSFTREVVIQCLKNIAHERKACVLITGSDLDYLKSITDEIGIMEDGKLISLQQLSLQIQKSVIDLEANLGAIGITSKFL